MLGFNLCFSRFPDCRISFFTPEKPVSGPQPTQSREFSSGRFSPIPQSLMCRIKSDMSISGIQNRPIYRNGWYLTPELQALNGDFEYTFS
jgi:hypothetical protein